jgi:hypothetical protein
MQAITMSKVATTERHRCLGRRVDTTTTVSLGAAAAVACERRLATSARSRSSSARSSALSAQRYIVRHSATVLLTVTMAPSTIVITAVITQIE